MKITDKEKEERVGSEKPTQEASKSKDVKMMVDMEEEGARWEDLEKPSTRVSTSESKDKEEEEGVRGEESEGPCGCMSVSKSMIVEDGKNEEEGEEEKGEDSENPSGQSNEDILTCKGIVRLSVQVCTSLQPAFLVWVHTPLIMAHPSVVCAFLIRQADAEVWAVCSIHRLFVCSLSLYLFNRYFFKECSSHFVCFLGPLHKGCI